jgi:disulfide bond formation protein DsbB
MSSLKILPKGITYGSISLALFIYMMLSGILLAIPFDINHVYESIRQFLVYNPWASFVRNLHYWSSQLFLIFTLFHLYQHYHNKEEINLKKGIAFRLSIGLLIIFMAILSGFLLKGDADSQQARQILDYLISGIPLIGKSLAFSLLGNPDSYLLIYVHHIATFSVFIGIIIVEHSRRFWPKPLDFILSFLVLIALSYFFSAPLHDNINPSVKGPWYFVGFQEILHWLRHPSWSLVLIFILLLFIYITNRAKPKTTQLAKRSLLFFTLFYALLTLIGLFFRGENWQWITPASANYQYSVLNNFKTERLNFSPIYLSDSLPNTKANGPTESCLACHADTHGFQSSHDPQIVGCFSCHGGNPFASDPKQAHRNMRLFPGNLENAAQSCGTANCHPDISQRINSGLMANLSGMISVDRFVFGEQDNPDALTDVHQLGNSAADEHLRNLCVKCHLGNPKTEWGPLDEESRGGGCLACHLNYNEKALAALKQHQVNNTDTTYLSHHPSLSLKISNEHCFGCHSRSGRIATNYEGWHETVLTADEMPDSSNYRLLKDQRVFKFIEDDVHHQRGLDCIDCHHSYELMGDGKRYQHEEDQQDVQCIDCHFSGKAQTTKASDLDTESALVSALRFGDFSGREFLTTHKQGHVLVNTWSKNDTSYLKTKNSALIYKLKSPSPKCQRDIAHKDLSCSACHSAWAPSCIGCHTAYDESEPGYNMITNKEKKGSWVEYAGQFDAKFPALGIRQEGSQRKIIPVVPGMVLSIDRKSFSKKEHDSLIFRRLFAPSAPHTTMAVGRDCNSCHRQSQALGFGEGTLKFDIKNGQGHWEFEAFYENNPNDGLPEDAWIGFLQNRKGMVSTRKNVFPFNIQEQKKILTVGACLNCHDGNSEIMQKSLTIPFEEYLKKISPKCILPHYQN